MTYIYIYMYDKCLKVVEPLFRGGREGGGGVDEGKNTLVAPPTIKVD